MGDPRDTNGTGRKVTLYGYVSNTEARPNSPAWAGGAGQFASPLQYGRSGGLLLHQQTIPARVTLDRQPGYSPSELWDGARCIFEARFLAEFTYAPQAILEETGRALGDILEGLLPGLIMTGCAVAVCTLLGAVVGGAVGFFAFGAGAAPGAAIGAEVGFDVGVALVTYLGLGFMLVYVAGSLGEVTSAMVEGVELAWNARGKSPAARRAGIHAGAKKMAHGMAVFFRLLLEAIVMFLLEKGAAAATARLAELMVKLKASDKLGSGFPEWVGKNYRSLLDDPKVNPQLRGRKSGGTTADDGAPAPTKPAAKEETPAAKKSQTNAEKGVFGEARGDDYMTGRNMQKMNGEPVKVGDKPLGQGIDGVWKNPSPPPDYVISETKYGSSQLGKTKDGPQMGDKWIDRRLDKAVGKAEADKIRDSMLEGKVEKWLLKVDEAGNVTKSILK
jgi:hypothetical protein